MRREPIVLHRQSVETPLGPMTALCSEQGIVLFEFNDNAHFERNQRDLFRRLPPAVVREEPHPHLDRLKQEIDEYFALRRTAFAVPLHPVGTDFQLAAWSALQRIPYGQTRSYAEEAVLIGRPTAVRAVANANGRNRLPILIPCHRVIGSDGSFAGYSAGIQRKAYLLALERKSSE